MSSLQKFHRRTFSGVGVDKVIGSEAPVAGSGFYLGKAGDGTSYMYVAPKSTEVKVSWGSNNTVRNTTSTTNGIANTNTLAGFGSAAHPAAHAAKTLTTGGYNTWYLPAKNEYYTIQSNRSAVPFATADSFVGTYRTHYWTSTEINSGDAWGNRIDRSDGGSPDAILSKADSITWYVRAARRSLV